MIRITRLSSLAVLFLLFLLCRCSAPATDNAVLMQEARKAIEESNAVYFQAFVKGDSSIFIERYAEDTCIMTPGSPLLCGPNAALEFYRIAYHDIKLRDGKFITTAVYGDGKEYVTEEGEWQSFDEHNAMFDNGKFLVLWKKTPKGWKMYRDSFSSNKN